jgi:hypothetical protein
VGLKENSNASWPVIITNTGNGILMIRNDAEVTVSYSILSLNGQLMTTGKLRGGEVENLPVSIFSQGVYLLKAESKAGTAAQTIVIH